MASNRLPLRCLALSATKRGHSAEEQEDACAANVALGRFAIADGATESSYAGLWARMLVDEFVNGAVEDPTTWISWLPALQTRWELAVGQQPLPWFAEIKRQQGAFATLLGVVLQPQRWLAVAVGDSCLFHVKGGHLVRAFPLTRSADFDCSPWLIGSRGFTTEMMALREHRLHDDNELAAGEQLWLMTDALASWFLRQIEHRERPCEGLEQVLASPDQQAHFKTWVDELRCQGQLRNDDTTLMKIWTDR